MPPSFTRSVRETPSIDQVAKAADVSTATVSRVINGTKAVSPAARGRVEASIQKLGYRANAFGRSLSTGQSRLLLVLVPDFANPYYAEIVSGAGAVARQHGYTLLPIDLEETWGTDGGSIEAVYSGLTDGVIDMLPLTSQIAMADKARRKPWVRCSEFPPDSDVPYVSIDHALAACDAVQYLINRGHRDIALINSDERYLYARQRREGFCRSFLTAKDFCCATAQFTNSETPLPSVAFITWFAYSRRGSGSSSWDMSRSV